MDENQKQEQAAGETSKRPKGVVSPMLWENFETTEQETSLNEMAKSSAQRQQELSAAQQALDAAKETLQAMQKKADAIAQKQQQIQEPMPSVSPPEETELPEQTENAVAFTKTEKQTDSFPETESIPIMAQQEIPFEELTDSLEETKILPPLPLQEDLSGTTQRLDTIHEEVKKKLGFADILERAEKNQYSEEELGDKNAYLDTFESEQFEEEPLPPEIGDAYFEEEDPSEEDIEDEDTGKNSKKWKWILLVAVVICFIVFFVGYIVMGTHQRKFREEQARLQAELPQAPTFEKRDFMVYSTPTSKAISVYDLETKEQLTIKTDNQTKFIDRSGKQASVTALEQGDLISITLPIQEETETPSEQIAIEIRYSADSWMAKEVSGLEVDPEAKTVSIVFVNGTEKKVYSYTEDSLFLYRGEELPPEDIASCDVITMQGKDDQVWSIDVVEYHGTMTLSHTEEIENGMLTLDEGDPIAIDGFTELDIPEGTHKLSVTGDNIEAYEDTIFIVPGETFSYDLSKAQSKTGVMILKANVYDFKLYINGADTDGTKPIVLPLGEYDVVVLKNGYKPWNEKVTIVEPSVTVEVTMQEDIQEGIISFHSAPQGASVLHNDTVLGVTPFEQKVRYGVYTVDFALEGYAPFTTTIVVDEPTLDVTAPLMREEDAIP